MPLETDRQLKANVIKEGSMLAAAVPAVAGTLIDLGATALYDHIDIDNTLNQPVTLTFPSGDVMSLEENDSFVYDSFVHGGIILIIHDGVKPTAGRIKTRSW